MTIKFDKMLSKIDSVLQKSWYNFTMSTKYDFKTELNVMHSSD